MIIIFAPHVDDEAIGCWSALSRNWRGLGDDVRVAYCEPINPIRRLERDLASEQVGFGFHVIDPKEETLYEYLSEVLLLFAGEISAVYAPDPHFELHPLHKTVGVMVHHLCRRRDIPFRAYSTNMNVPYLKELTKEEASEKKDFLDLCYPSQSSLWERDHRYWLFEGIAQWNPEK